MISCLCVGAGGCLGAMARYLMSLILYTGNFPLITMSINFIGAVAIGAVLQASEKVIPSQNLVLFLSTGVCGGFTTFSTFSAETFDLFSHKSYLSGSVYAVGSVVVCLLGVYLGKILCASLIKGVVG
ncbi:MAG: fluoride efflux transporter CrcB [Anaerovoracaceae bacterium]